ncbi:MULTISPECIES: hypothetical protein [Vibrio]|uniref:hypothetical protein n=1 Tax=Vibrio TaxID=662 RepID=UPI000C169AC9|nr:MULTISPECIES: hypothetical protein [Vibrio]NAW68362.1 hypothetical protein [Vibrio sp. V28_P6S34P95]NAX04770.1 hypothetical protein [Vibrio sp. V30_P3S12P165]NAX35456.1 hypothetical protein [Vibrio sp. V29_P1S30P107]NAX37644.1 hypothetical protein [Vibrio sp. V27_P1S3P104]NAX39392.1 hypothetical protein [Vibrio sp. V26_P1S5P106]
MKITFFTRLLLGSVSSANRNQLTHGLLNKTMDKFAGKDKKTLDSLLANFAFFHHVNNPIPVSLIAIGLTAKCSGFIC